ncbi:MAG: zinc ribbon domain-containing protein [Phycisphaerales bacterium]|nr:zinc ribbon domain-containing protein [Phycisphaerales bacterium]
MRHENWECPKCSHREFDTSKMAATGGGLSKIFDVQNKKFTTVTCTQCAYTEFYKVRASAIGNVFDFFTG